jgi:Ca2+-transporting ATPase
MRKMLKENNLVRKLHACETMGATTVICTDKTGTLTQNRMSVVEHRFFGDYDREELALGISVNSTAALTVERTPIGNPTEGALLMWLDTMGFDYQQLRDSAKVVGQQPFSTQTKYMLTRVEKPDGTVVKYVKGAPELLLDRCEEIAGGVTKHEVEELLASYQQRAMRTLGFAMQQGEGPHTFLGVVGIADPIRPDVAQAIHQCKDVAGVKVIIVTGDTVGTANEIGREIGLLKEGELDKTLQGPDFATRSDKDLRELLRDYRIRIIARARPEDKARLVTLLQQNHEVVAVTGDGTNDAPALNRAHVGLSLGSGTSVAKQASDITIIDDSFRSIVHAVMWGRSLYINIQRFVFFQLVVNVAALLLVLFGAFIGTEMPLTITQILWVNLIMDTFAAMALASLPPSREVLDEKPRSADAFIITPGMGRGIVIVGCLLFAVTAAMLYYLERHTAMGTRELTIFFTIFVMMQWWNLFNARALGSSHSALRRIWACPAFLLVLLMILLGQWLIVTFGGRIFRTEPLTPLTWLVIIAVTSPVLILGELYRWVKRCRNT